MDGWGAGLCVGGLPFFVYAWCGLAGLGEAWQGTARQGVAGLGLFYTSSTAAIFN